jgi:hypothetical protein
VIVAEVPLLHGLGKPKQAMKRLSPNKCAFASPRGSVILGTQWVKPCASTEGITQDLKIGIINVGLFRDLSEIKLKRTDTTLDLSQKAKRAKEKRKEESVAWTGYE